MLRISFSIKRNYLSSSLSLSAYLLVVFSLFSPRSFFISTSLALFFSHFLPLFIFSYLFSLIRLLFLLLSTFFLILFVVVGFEPGRSPFGIRGNVLYLCCDRQLTYLRSHPPPIEIAEYPLNTNHHKMMTQYLVFIL